MTLTVTEADKVELAFQDARDMGDIDYETALDWAADAMTDEHDGSNTWQSIETWRAIRDIGERVWSS